MPARNELAMRARNVGFDASTIPNDSKLEQKVLWLEKNSGANTGTAAASTLTSNNTQQTDGDTVTIGPITYTGKTTLVAGTPYQYLIVTDADTSLGNLVSAINNTGTVGTDYTAATPKNPYVSAAAVSSHATVVTSRDTNANNTLGTTKVAATLSWTGATLSAGTPGVSGVIAAGTSTYGSGVGIAGDKNTSI